MLMLFLGILWLKGRILLLGTHSVCNGNNNCNCNWGTFIVPPTRRPRAHQSQSVSWCP